MSHEFESGVFTREPAWHGLGVTLPDRDSITVSEALSIGRLDWDVVKVPVTYKGETVPERYFTVRTLDDHVLGVVGEQYRPAQNREAFAWADGLVGGGCKVITAGALREGRRVWVLVELPERSSKLPAGEDLRHFLLLWNSHDGSTAVRCQLTTVRVVCNNTLGWADSQARKMKVSYSIRHTRNAEERLGEAQRVLGLAEQAAEQAERIATELIARAMPRPQFREFLNELVPVPAEIGRSRTMAQNVQAGIITCYSDSPDIAPIRETAWGALQAVTEYDSHLARGRATSGASLAENRFVRLTGGDSLGTRALDILVPVGASA